MNNIASSSALVTSSLPERIVSSFSNEGAIQNFVHVNASYVHLHAFLCELRNSKDATLLSSAVHVLRARFFAMDAEEPVNLGSSVNPLVALDRVIASGATQLPEVLVSKLTALTTKKLEALVQAYNGISVF
jgi:hypothetical protein